jgi:hypothetical protein
MVKGGGERFKNSTLKVVLFVVVSYTCIRSLLSSYSYLSILNHNSVSY